MKCPRCNNTDLNYFYKGAKGYYCRKCISFKRILIKEDIYPKDYEVESDGSYTLKFSLTPYQIEVAYKLINEIKEADVLLHAATGSGKTEIVMPLISYYLKRKKRVCYAISRREVVIELAARFNKAFKNTKVIKVCEGYTKDIYADLIVCTTHQLYRYPKTFDLLILDEVDAFPFKGNEVLANIALNSLNDEGRIVYSTATIDKDIEYLMANRKTKTLTLNRRPHNKPIIKPKVIYSSKLLSFFILFYLLKKSKTKVIVFVETISLCKTLYLILKNFFSITLVYSNLESRNQNIKDFKDDKYRHILATTVLERGITIKGVDVIILKYSDGLFDRASIIQMSGRVGRAYTMPYGNCYILTSHKDKEIDDALKEIDRANEVYLL